jgi:hypothetical protein
MRGRQRRSDSAIVERLAGKLHGRSLSLGSTRCAYVGAWADLPSLLPGQSPRLLADAHAYGIGFSTVILFKNLYFRLVCPGFEMILGPPLRGRLAPHGAAAEPVGTSVATNSVFMTMDRSRPIYTTGSYDSIYAHEFE